MEGACGEDPGQPLGAKSEPWPTASKKAGTSVLLLWELNSANNLRLEGDPELQVGSQPWLTPCPQRQSPCPEDTANRPRLFTETVR